MITIQENGKTYSIINSREKWIEINGVKYKFPKRVKGHSVSQIDNHIFIAYHNSIKALWVMVLFLLISKSV